MKNAAGLRRCTESDRVPMIPLDLPRALIVALAAFVGAPPLTAHAWRDAKGGDLAAIFYIDTHGVRGTVMVSHPGGISDADAVRVATYIWSVGHGRAKP